jgi:hypothetical protein
MSRSALRVPGLLLLALLLIISSSAPLCAQEASSSALVKELTALLDAAKLDSIAAREAQPDAYVAALYYPGTMLIVVGSRYKEPVLLNERLAKKEYRDVYIDLNSAALPKTKCLVTDLGADGLKAKSEEGKPFDTIERTDGQEFRFNGDWKAQKISEEDYNKAFTDAEARYVKMLQALIVQAKKPS